MGTVSLEPSRGSEAQRPLPVDPKELVEIITGVQNRWPSPGLSVAIVSDAGLAWFRGQGVADTTSRSPVTEDTVFRVGSLTKTFTAIAVMQPLRTMAILSRSRGPAPPHQRRVRAQPPPKP